MTQAPSERVQKALARAGFGSRRACEDLLRAGRVRVNGEVAELGSKVDAQHDVVEVDGVFVSLQPDLVYLALNKPTGVLSTMKDTRGRTTVMDLVPLDPRVFPVGRLDRDTSGLILLTNDGDFANHVAHPRYGVAKTYVADVRGRASASVAGALRKGIKLDDGPARAQSVRVRSSGGGRAIVELVVHEGRNRMVRRMLDAVGLDVVELARTAIGPIRLGRLRPGTWRALRREEIVELLLGSPPTSPGSPAPHGP